MKTGQIIKQRNSSIDIARYVFSILIVVGHIEPLKEYNKELSFALFRVMGRVAVPFFFCVTGYYFIKALLSGRNTFKKQFTSLVCVYLFWSILYCAINLLIAIKNGIPWLTIIKELIIQILFSGTYYHFWYFPAIIFSLCCVYAAFSLKGEKGIKILAGFSLLLYVIGVMGSGYYGIGITIPCLKSLYSLDNYLTLRGLLFMGLPFFLSSYWLILFEKRINSWTMKKTITLLCTTILLFIVEVTVLSIYNIHNDVAETFLLYPYLLIVMIALFKNPLPEYHSISEKSRKMANYIYFIHPFMIFLIYEGTSVIGYTITPTILCITVLVVCMSSAYWCVKHKAFFLNRFI